MNSLVCVQDYEDKALQILTKNAGDYFKSGSDDELTLKWNIEAFKRWLIRPRMLRDVSRRNLEKSVQGIIVPFPIGFSPVGFQGLAHEQGEVAVAKAASSMGTIFVLSTYATRSIEEIAEACPLGKHWFQLFPNADNNVSIDLVQRAESAGFKAIVVTLDAQNFGNKRRITRSGLYMPPHVKLANLTKYMIKSESGKEMDVTSHVHQTLAQDLTWDIISLLRKHTTLPLILKGILTPEYAKLALKLKINGIWISNHGGRQVDTAPQPIDVLPEISSVVKGRCEIYLDSGVRKGSDIFKALALGATMAFVGRPQIWGVTVNGEQGAEKVLGILRDELDLTMALSGVADVNDISFQFVCHKSELNAKL